jgi:LacI family transcriptional regulator
MKTANVLLMITPSSPGRFNGITRFARANGWHLTVADRLTHTLNGWTGDGALVTLRDDKEIEKRVKVMRRKGIPVVDLSFSRPDIKVPRVAGDNALIGQIAAEHFKKRLFKNVAWFSTSWGHQHDLRYRSFASSLDSSTEKWIWEDALKSAKSDDWKNLSKYLIRHLEKIVKPAAIFCFDDADASCVESAALRAGFKIPEEIAILGAGDDEPLCESQIIPISSVKHDLENVGYEGAKLLASLMNGEKPPQEAILIAPKGIAERASTDTLAVPSTLTREARDIYLKNLSNPPSTEMLATELGVSRATLDRAFAADIGFSPAKMLSRLRLDESKRLLKHSKLTVSEIAYSLGYCNSAYFVNTFKKEMGVSPRKWRGIFSDNIKK